MEILLSLNPIHFPNFRLSLAPNFISFSRKPSFFFPPSFNRKQNHPFLCSISHTYPPNSSNYSGWDDLELSQHPNPSGNFERFRRFLIALGIDDRKHVLLFFFGFLSALAVSRVRVASIVVFPATVLVFGIGFSIGVLIRSGDDDGILPKGIGGYLIKKLSKEESGFMFSGEKLRDLSDLLSNLAAKITDLTNMIQGGTRSNQIEMREIEIYLEIIESLRSALMPAKDLVDKSIDNQLSTSNGHMNSGSNVSKSNAMLVGDQALEKSTNLKATRRGRELGVDGFDFVRFLGGVFGDNSVGLKAYRAKGNSKPEFTEKLNSIEANNRILTSDTGLAYGFEDKTCLNGVSNNSVGSLLQEAVVKYKCDDHKAENSEAILEPFDKTSSEMFRSVGTVFEEEKILNRTTSIIEGKNFNDSREQKFNSDLLSYNEGTGNHNTTIQFTNNFENFRKTSDQCLSEAKTPQDVRHDLNGIDFNLRSQENGLNSLATESEGSCDRAYLPSRHNKNGKVMNRNATHGFDFKGGAMRLEDQPFLVNHRSKRDINVEETSSSSVISDDGEFNRYLKEGANLLRQARGVLRGHIDEEEAEIILYKSASLLSRAIAMKPTSLHAVGQLGNTFLLHGELKLKISHKLRTNLSKSDFLLDEKEPRVQLKRTTNQVWSKDKLESVLIDVCEECEELLVEAGRKYRMALSINVNDVRALYNWGLALTFRAQLIADIGPEAAFDADKLYLAAIDKFDAMMSRSNAFVPEALFRWGVALQQRSRLRMRSSEENKKLLLQAKRLFEDALHMNSHNLQVREALSSCISQINSLNHF